MAMLFLGVIGFLALLFAGFWLPLLWIPAAVLLLLVVGWFFGERRRSSLSRTGNPTNTGESAGTSAPPQRIPAPGDVPVDAEREPVGRRGEGL